MSYFFVFTLLLIAAVGIAVSPWCGSLELLGFVFFLQGISHSNLNAGIHVNFKFELSGTVFYDYIELSILGLKEKGGSVL